MSGAALNANPMWVNILIFLAGAAVIWTAGVTLERSADAISCRTGLKRAFVGVLFLSIATSLPETAGTITSVMIGNPTLAVHGLIGAVMTQMTLLVVADFVTRDRGALTHFRPQFVLLFEGIGVIALLAIAIAGMAAGPLIRIALVDLWAVLIVAAYVLVIFLTYRLQTTPRWRPIREEGFEESPEDEQDVGINWRREWSNRAIVVVFALAALAVLAAGYTVARVVDVLAVQTGLGASFAGVTLLGFATSLPELSTVVSASRKGAYSLAVANIFGTNMYNIFLLSIAEFIYITGNVFAGIQPTAIFGGAVAIVIACVYLWGLLEHRDRTILGIGLDSFVVALIYLSGLYALYMLR